MMRRSSLLAVPVVLALLAGCGSGQKSTQASAAKGGHSAAELQAARKQAADAQQAADRCETQMRGLLRRVKALHSRLDIGLNYERYSEQVANLRVAYDNIDFKAGGIKSYACLSQVGVPLEAAMNTYVAAYRIWNKCFEDLYCENDSITGKLQAKWATADRQLNVAEKGLDHLKRVARDAQEKVDRMS